MKTKKNRLTFAYPIYTIMVGKCQPIVHVIRDGKLFQIFEFLRQIIFVKCGKGIRWEYDKIVRSGMESHEPVVGRGATDHDAGDQSF